MNQNISTLILLLISVIIFFVYTAPISVSIQKLTSELEELEKVGEKANELASKQDEQREKLEGFVEYEDGLEKIVPVGRDDARALMYISSIADASGNIFIRNMRVLDGSPLTKGSLVTTKYRLPYNVKTIELAFDASYEDFGVFLTNLERSKRIFDPVHISFSASAVDYYEFRMSIHTYWIEQ